MIEGILPNNRAKVKILTTILSNPGINISGIIKKTKTSPNLVVGYVNKMVNYNVLREERAGGKKKTHIRFLYPKLSKLGIEIFSLIETEKRMKFLKKYPQLAPIFDQLIDFAEQCNIDFIVVFGSFARFAAEADSDLDLLIIGKTKNIENKLNDILITLGREYSVKIQTKSKFIENVKKKSLYKNVLKEHVLIYGENNYFQTVRDL